jgi:hypothetical protein
MSSEILRLSSQFGSGKRKCGFCIRQRFIINFLKDVWRLIVLVTITAILRIVVVVVVVVVVVAVVWSFRYIVSMMANMYEGSFGKVPDIEDVELPPFPGKYNLVYYEIQFQDVRECAFMNDSKGGVEGGVVDLPL